MQIESSGIKMILNVLKLGQLHEEKKKVNFQPTFIVVHLSGPVILLLLLTGRHLLELRVLQSRLDKARAEGWRSIAGMG